MGPLYGVIENFEGKHYMLWKFKMETLLKARELWGLIDNTEVKPNLRLHYWLTPKGTTKL